MLHLCLPDTRDQSVDFNPKGCYMVLCRVNVHTRGEACASKAQGSRRHHVCASLTVSLHGTGGCASCRDGLLT
jgi:hypothetical protein